MSTWLPSTSTPLHLRPFSVYAPCDEEDGDGEDDAQDIRIQAHKDGEQCPDSVEVEYANVLPEVGNTDFFGSMFLDPC